MFEVRNIFCCFSVLYTACYLDELVLHIVFRLFLNVSGFFDVLLACRLLICNWEVVVPESMINFSALCAIQVLFVSCIL